jgi:hypothetical protein
MAADRVRLFFSFAPSRANQDRKGVRVVGSFRIFIEAGQKKTFAGSLEWPGYCRWGQNEQAAIQSLVDCGARYARVLEGSGLSFRPPAALADLLVVEHQAGSSTTDFGAPDAILSSDHKPLQAGEVDFFRTILQACWQAFDRAVLAARGQDLRKGPRGGGRDLEKILNHLIEGDRAYLGRLAWKFSPDQASPPDAELARIRQAILAAMQAAQNGDLPAQGPRGGKVWPLRFFVRRTAWHTLDHTWEIEDRLGG